jgi:hypothetical protein
MLLFNAKRYLTFSIRSVQRRQTAQTLTRNSDQLHWPGKPTARNALNSQRSSDLPKMLLTKPELKTQAYPHSFNQRVFTQVGAR